MSDEQRLTWTPKDTRELLDHGKAIWDWLKKRWPSKPNPTDTLLPESTEPERGILVIGPGGTGKSTFAMLLSGQLQPWIFGDHWKYQESIGEEVFALLDVPGVEIVVPAGQEHRREASWANIRADIGAGRYSGIVLTTAYGHHAFSGLGYKLHPLFRGAKPQFLADFAEEKRKDEIRALEFILPALESAPDKLWLMTLATKQDLWWGSREDAQRFYTDGKWKELLTHVSSIRGAWRFRHEYCAVSLTLSNLTDPEGNVLFPTTAGYDMGSQAETVKRWASAFDALRKWEEK